MLSAHDSDEPVLIGALSESKKQVRMRMPMSSDSSCAELTWVLNRLPSGVTSRTAVQESMSAGE